MVVVHPDGRRSQGMGRIHRWYLDGGVGAHCMTYGPSSLGIQGADPS